MDSSSSRAESMKPVILKAGVGLILSATGLIFARFMTRREDNQVTSSASNPETYPSCREDYDGGEEEEEVEEEAGLMEDSETRYERDYEQEILRLKARFEELQKRENEMEMRFLHYCNLKDKENMLLELKSMLKLEKAHIDFFGREVSTMEEENKMIQDWVIVYLKLVEKIQCLRAENGLLQSKAKKLKRRTKELSSVIKAKNARMGGLEQMLLRNLEEFETKNKFVNEMEDEIKELKTVIDRLEEEKNELLSKSSKTKPETEYEETTVAVEDYKRLLEEYENLKRERADEVKDLINYKWRNACLRYAVMRYRERDQEKGSRLEDIALGGNENFHQHLSLEEQMALEAAEEHHEHDEHLEEHQHQTSRRKRLLKRLKRLVEWPEKGKSKSEERCFGRHSDTVEPEEEQANVLARRSCSRA